MKPPPAMPANQRKAGCRLFSTGDSTIGTVHKLLAVYCGWCDGVVRTVDSLKKRLLVLAVANPVPIPSWKADPFGKGSQLLLINRQF